MVSELAAKHVKVVLGGQGGDEIFGGYARYLVAYFEQCIKAAIEGTYKNGNYVVTIESIVPNLGILREYKPMLREFWREGLFSDIDSRYFRLIDRSSDMTEEVDWHALDKDRVFQAFRAIFNNPDNVGHEAYFDKMTHFDFKCLLPALLHVEDRMSMAHGLESRVPFLDHPLVEFAATVPADSSSLAATPSICSSVRLATNCRIQSSTAATRWAFRCRSRNGSPTSYAISYRTCFGLARRARARS